tara:strand:- start:392 stop:613 length:222 start_codon:yes stop_codon:yes gene_type:complete
MDTKQLEKYLQELQTDYKTIFNSDEGKRVIADLEKRCHFMTTTNIKGDSHESCIYGRTTQRSSIYKTNAAKKG